VRQFLRDVFDAMGDRLGGLLDIVAEMLERVTP